ncbi:Flp family type IVb pilin [Aquamicrobium ahrensii]|uniref:Flp pilus assembly pilin Flp n=1 Tax=Aquamicrobium ahrensii TaxID=469551 RepID=A0ABV2KNZ7_9HYPH
MARLIRYFLDDQNGTAAIEYGLIATLITLAIIVAVGGAADEVVAMWSSNEGQISQALK